MIPKADINTFTNMEPWGPRVTDKRDDFPSLASPSSPPSQQGIGGTFADSALLNPPLITNFFHQNNDSTDNKNGINVDNIFASMTEDEAEAPNGNMIYYNTTKSNIFHNFASINNDNRSALTRQESHRYDQRAISSSSSTVTPSIPIRKYSDYTNYYSSRDKAVIPVMTTTHVNNYYGGSIAKTGDCADNGGRISICRSESNDVLSKSMGNTLSRLASKTMTEGYEFMCSLLFFIIISLTSYNNFTHGIHSESDPTPTIRHAGYLLKRSNMPHVVREDEYTLGDIAQIAPLPDLSDLNIEEKECGRPFFNGLFPLVGGVESNGVSTMSSSERALDNSALSTVKLDTTFRDPIPTTSVTRISSDECITANDEETCFCSQFANYLKQIFDNNRPRDALITSDRTNCRTINLRARSKSQPPISSPVPNQYKMPLKSPAPARSIPVPISPVGQQRATIIPRPRSFSTTLPFVNTGTVEGANTHLRKEYPPPPPDDIDPKDGHIWRSKYCILEEGILYFYRTAEEGESDEARQERYEHRLYSEELEDIVLGEELVSPQRSVAGSKRWSMLSTEDRKSSHDIYDLSKSPMPQRKSDLFGFHNSPFHRQGSSVLIGPIIDAAGDDRGGSRSVMKHTSSISTFQNDDEILWEKRVALNCVGAVRSSEQEHGIHAFELLAYGCGGPDNDTASTFQGEGQNDDVIDRLILRASSSDDRNAWMFQFHRSLTSFVLQQFVTKSTSVAHGNRLWGMRPDSPNNRGGQHRLRLPSGGAVGKGGSIVSPFVAKSSFATSPSGNNSFGGTSFSPHVVGSLSHGHGRNALYRRKVRDGKNAGGDASVVSPLQTPAGTPRGGSSPVELMPSMIMIQSDSSKKQHKVELSSLKGLRDREKIKDGRKSPAATAFASVAPQKYVPPHMRSTASSSASAAPQKYVPPHMRKKLSVSSVDDDAFVVSKKLEENQLSSMDDATKQTKMSKAASIAPVISSESFDGSDTPLSASSMLSEQLDDSENFASASIRLGGCADPRVIVGSILDHHYINRKASVVGNARLDAYGGTGGGYFRRIFKNQTTMDDASSDEDEIWEAMQRSAEPLPTGGGYFNEDEIWEAIQRSAEPLPIRAGEWQGDNGESYHHGESSPTANTYPSSPPPTRAGTGPTTNIMATAAAAGLAATAAAVGGVALCEREGAVRDPKTVYGLHADDVMKMELKRFRSERQPHDPSVKIHHCRTEDETNLLDDLGMIMLNTKSAALKWEVGASSECGVRNSNEDSFVAINNLDNLMKSQGLVSFSEQDLGQTKQQGMYAIFDGHVGNQAAR
jgi:hypothetical protein